MSSFSFGVANRTASIRIPRETDKNRYGYIEDRRPSGSANMYVVTAKLLERFRLYRLFRNFSYRNGRS